MSDNVKYKHIDGATDPLSIRLHATYRRWARVIAKQNCGKDSVSEGIRYALQYTAEKLGIK
jgi:hypothetical protein